MFDIFASIIILLLNLGLNFCLLKPLCAFIILFWNTIFFGLKSLKLKIDSKFLLLFAFVKFKFWFINSSKKILLKFFIIKFFFSSFISGNLYELNSFKLIFVKKGSFFSKEKYWLSDIERK